MSRKPTAKSPVSETPINRRQVMLGASLSAAALATGAASTASAATSSDAPDLSGKSILITGSSSGFGRLGAEHYARLGAKVFATMRNVPRVEAAELEALAKSDNLDISVLEMDITSDEQVKSAIASALGSAGHLDVVINNAGISYAGPIEVQDIDATQHIFDTNVYGAQRVARAVLPSMRARKSGYIINVSSQLGRLIIPGFAMYSASKFALEGMSEQMAYELVAHGIDVTIVQPGGYPTKIWANQAPLSKDLKDRTEQERLSAYPAMTAVMGTTAGGGSNTDPMDIPRNIAEMIAMTPGSRPLRRAVHPTSRPQEPINEVAAQQQVAFLGGSPMFGPMMKAVHD